MFQIVCQNCEFMFATEYRLLKHEQTCDRESRSEEDMEKIHYKLQMYELLEESLKYNMTKHQTTSSVPPAKSPNIETSAGRKTPQTQCETELLGLKRIKSELAESREDPVSNLHQENIGSNGRDETTVANPSVITNESTRNLGNLRTVKAEVHDQNCSNSSATNTQSNVKTEPKDVDTSEVEVLGTVEIRKRKTPERPADRQANNNNLRQTKQTKTNLEPAQIPRLNSAKDQEEPMITSTSTCANLTKRIDVSGPLLHPEEVYPEVWQERELRTYFSQFGKINSIAISDKSGKTTVTFDNFESAAKCIEQRTHKIRGQDFIVRAETPILGMKNNIRTNQRIIVTGPCLNPEIMDSKEQKKLQKQEFRTYFGQFGKVIVVSYLLPTLEANVAFDNCESAAKCIEQRTHKICGHDFVVRKESLPTIMEKKERRREKRLKNRLRLKTHRANLRQNISGPLSENKLKQKQKLGPTLSQHMPGPSTGNVSAANVKSGPPAWIIKLLGLKCRRRQHQVHHRSREASLTATLSPKNGHKAVV